MRGLYKGVSQRGIFEDSTHTETHGEREHTAHTDRETETDQCVTVDKVAHTVHTEE